jgi:hypothetical protein
MAILSLFCRKSLLLIILANATVLDHYGQLDPDPHQIGKLDPDLDPDSHKITSRIRIRIKMKRWRP